MNLRGYAGFAVAKLLFLALIYCFCFLIEHLTTAKMTNMAGLFFIVRSVLVVVLIETIPLYKQSHGKNILFAEKLIEGCSYSVLDDIIAVVSILAIKLAIPSAFLTIEVWSLLLIFLAVVFFPAAFSAAIISQARKNRIG